jgi:hypothetical protein
MSEKLKYTWEDDGQLLVKVEYEPPETGILRALVSQMYPNRNLRIPRNGIAIDLEYYQIGTGSLLSQIPNKQIATLTLNGGGQIISLKIEGIEGIDETFVDTKVGDREIIMTNGKFSISIHSGTLNGHIICGDKSVYHMCFFYQ